MRYLFSKVWKWNLNFFLMLFSSALLSKLRCQKDLVTSVGSLLAPHRGDGEGEGSPV